MSVALDAGTDRDRKETFDREFDEADSGAGPEDAAFHLAEQCAMTCACSTHNSTTDTLTQ